MASQEDLNRIQEKLQPVLEIEGVSSVEMNEQTLPILQRVLDDYDSKKVYYDVISQQIMQETEEFIIDQSRMNKVLESLDLDPVHGISPKVKKYVKSLSTAIEALDVASFSLPMLVVALMDLQDAVRKSSVKIQAVEEQCGRLNEDVGNIRNKLEIVQKQFTELESQLPHEQKSVESLKKSNRFHIQKKKQYESNSSQSERSLREVGFSTKFSHFELVQIGQRALELEEKLRPMLMELRSYKQLPPDANLARLKLCEVMNELKQTEEDLHDVFQQITLSS